ncbi:aspartate aminotransferase family protein [Pleionea sp. CnH1-48]|uniref:pyridoxal phosphate-dependent decarboxylase family protein n=1 Tax=Pleionea sp. CnH1-48 TaxID=2954494 RepID=UPI002096B31C|nr:aspartate aminotransferase family protein [Pleionea sp. CnH1-48]MCO7224565.1 aspartate aminotransferase family protein [Pleionea sp. CnH1-48]
MGNAEFLSSTNQLESLEGRSVLTSENYLFNQDNADNYQHNLELGVELISTQLKNIQQPFTGILPHELAPKFESVDLEQPLSSVEEVLKEVKSLYLDDAIYFHHPKYVAHLNCPVVLPAVLGEMILSSVNSSMDTWDQSAGGTLIEQSLLDWTCQRIGYDQQGDGIFTSGGTQSNLMALLLARDHFCTKRGHSIKEKGLPPYAHKLRIFTSEISHFSVQKSAALLGLGYDSVISVPVDEHFRMDAVALEDLIRDCLKNDEIPMAVVATTGTTDFGSIDPIHAIAELCKTYQMWMHADAAYGCGLLVSNKHRHLLDGIEKADSVTVDYHKSYFQPVSCGAFYTKDKNNLSFVTHHAEYLNPLSQSQEGTPNLVNKSIQTTRRFDSLKLWLTLRMMGPAKVGQMFDDVMALAQSAYELYRSDNNINILHKPQISTLVFRYVPSEPCDPEVIDKANEFIRKAIFRSGEAVIASTKVNDRRYLKFTLLNPSTSMEHLGEILQLIKQYGEQSIQEQLASPSITQIAS